METWHWKKEIHVLISKVEISFSSHYSFWLCGWDSATISSTIISGLTLPQVGMYWVLHPFSQQCIYIQNCTVRNQNLDKFDTISPKTRKTTCRKILLISVAGLHEDLLLPTMGGKAIWPLLSGWWRWSLQTRHRPETTIQLHPWVRINM